MRLLFCSTVVAAMLTLVAGCVPGSVNERNAFLTLTETFGVPSSDDDQDRGAAGGVSARTEFRRQMDLTFVNNHPEAALNVSVAAWVKISSIRSADQQDALLTNGYVQLTRQVDLGTVFTLPPGTFVFNGPGAAGATPIRLNRAANNAPTSETITLTTPDVVLVYSQPPISCDSVAFFYTIDDEVVFEDDGNPSRRVFAETGLKTLVQIDVYQCEPLKPGLFLKTGGGTRAPNEFFEGESATFNFFRFPDDQGNFANVTIQ